MELYQAIKKRPRNAGLVIMMLSLAVQLPLACHGFATPQTTCHFLGVSRRDNVNTKLHSHYNIPRKRPPPFQFLFMSSEVNDEGSGARDTSKESSDKNDKVSLSSILLSLQDKWSRSWTWKGPPFDVEDVGLLYYDIFLIINLVLSISFWVTHRMDITFLPVALSEGSLMSLLWIAAGLFNGAFLYSAIDGHYEATDVRGGPKAACILGFQTFLGAINLRLVVALIMACIQHQAIGSTSAEELVPLEIGFGLILMSVFRFVHSSVAPRI